MSRTYNYDATGVNTEYLQVIADDGFNEIRINLAPHHIRKLYIAMKEHEEKNR